MAAHYKGLSQDFELTPSPSPAPGQRYFDDSNNDLVGLYQYGNVSEPKLNSPTGARAIPRRKDKKRMYTILGVMAFLIIAAAVVIIVIISRKSSSSSSKKSGSSGDKTATQGATSGGDGTTVLLGDGKSTFVYRNKFGGNWAEDPKNPFGMAGKAQSWSKSTQETWVWGNDVVRGVNLGGWLVTEPFICPALYEKYINSSSIKIIDEWTLSQAMGSNLASEMEAHYATFITEEDFADIAGAGLNWVRIPIGFWTIETINDEPFLVGTSWKYFLKAIEWGRKYGIRIYLDLHALPGSQNGWNHSGKSGSVNFMNGVMGIANAQRTLSYLRIITEFVSQDQYKDVVMVVGIVNEILWSTIGKESVQSFYVAAYQAMRGSTGTGTGKGPYIAIHEAFQGPAIWQGFLSGSDRVALDQHPYLAFMGDTTDSVDVIAKKPCAWAIATNQSSKVFGVTLGGEFSSAINDCGLWLNGIGSTPGFPDCKSWDDWASWNSTLIASLKQVTLASMDALQNSFFWTWKIGNSTVLGTSSCPLWHYQLGLKLGFIPSDPREAAGHCNTVLGSSQIFDGNYPPTATGGAGAGTLDPTVTAQNPFPPATISPTFSGTQIALLPTYTATGTIKTLFAPTFTAVPNLTVGTGWTNQSDNGLAYVPVKGCNYPDPWNAVNETLPTAACKGS